MNDTVARTRLTRNCAPQTSAGFARRPSVEREIGNKSFIFDACPDLFNEFRVMRAFQVAATKLSNKW